MGGYVAAALGALGLAALRRRPVLLRGRTLLAFTVLFAVASTAASVTATGSVPAALLVFEVAALAAAWGARGRWLIVHATPEAVGAAVERCTRMLCASVERAGDAYAVPLAGGALRLTVRRASRQAAVVAFAGATRQKKAVLLRRLLAKQYDGVLPRIKLGSRV